METTKNTPSLDGWQQTLLQKIASDEAALGSLFDLLYLAWEFRDSRKSVEFQAELFAHWINSKEVDLNKRRTEIRDFITQLVFVSRLKEEFDFFDHNSGYTNTYARKEVGYE